MSNFIQSFLDKLEENHINYLHWKSNTNIEKALIGEDDLDILVDPNKKYEIYQLFKEMHILRAYSEKDSWQNEIFHYFGLDIEAQKMIHIHLHFLLEVGYDFDKSVNLPIVKTYMESKEYYKNRIYIPSVENEYILLIIRLMLKNALTPFLMLLPMGQWAMVKSQSRKGVVRGSAYREYLDLRHRSNREKLEEALDTTFPFLDKALFYSCEEVIEQNNSLKAYFAKSKAMKKALEAYSYHSGWVSFFKSFYRINQVRLEKVLGNRVKSKKIPANGGRIFAFVGGDGAGKSSNIEKLSSVLGHHYYVETIHVGRPNQVGRPKNYFMGRQIRNIGKLLMRVGVSSLGNALNYVGLAVERKQAFMKAQNIKAQGGIVILDRIPLEGVSKMDGPSIEREMGDKHPWLAKIEQNLHRSITGIDELIVLKLDPKIALVRRPEDDPDELLIRSGQIWEYDFSNRANTTVIDTSNSFKYVEDHVLTTVWASLNAKVHIAELAGLAGTGKSTTKNYLQEQYPTAQFALNDEGRGVFLCQNFCKYFKIYIQIKEVKVELVKASMKMDIFLHNLKDGNYDKNRMFLFDQGAIYYTMMLMVEIPKLESLFLAELSTLLPYYDEVIFLEAPLEVLYERINNREQNHRIKEADMFVQRAFLESHYNAFIKILDLCRQHGVRVHQIDTHENSITMVEEQIDGILRKN